MFDTDIILTDLSWCHWTLLLKRLGVLAHVVRHRAAGTFKGLDG